MANKIRVNGRDLRAIAYGEDIVWKSTCARLAGLINARQKRM